MQRNWITGIGYLQDQSRARDLRTSRNLASRFAEDIVESQKCLDSCTAIGTVDVNQWSGTVIGSRIGTLNKGINRARILVDILLETNAKRVANLHANGCRICQTRAIVYGIGKGIVANETWIWRIDDCLIVVQRRRARLGLRNIDNAQVIAVGIGIVVEDIDRDRLVNSSRCFVVDCNGCLGNSVDCDRDNRGINSAISIVDKVRKRIFSREILVGRINHNTVVD